MPALSSAFLSLSLDEKQIRDWIVTGFLDSEMLYFTQAQSWHGSVDGNAVSDVLKKGGMDTISSIRPRIGPMGAPGFRLFFWGA